MQKEKKRSTVLFSLLGVFLLLIASLSFWFYKHIYDSRTFQTHVTTALQTGESRNAIASMMIEEAFKNRPRLKSLIEEQAAPILAGVLERPRIQEIMKRFVLKVHDSLLSDHPRAVAIDLTSIKNTITNLTYFLEQVTDKERQNVQIPDQLVLIRAGEIPSIGKFGLTLLWVGPLAFLGGLGLLAWLIVRAVQKVQVIKLIGYALAGLSLVFIILTQWYKPIMLAAISNSDARIVGEQILNEFLKSLMNQTWILFILGILMIGGGFLFERFYPKQSKAPSK